MFKHNEMHNEISIKEESKRQSNFLSMFYILKVLSF